MKKAGSSSKAASSPASAVFVQRVTGRISAVQYLRAIDQRVSEQRRDEQRHRRGR